MLLEHGELWQDSLANEGEAEVVWTGDRYGTGLCWRKRQIDDGPDLYLNGLSSLGGFRFRYWGGQNLLQTMGRIVMVNPRLLCYDGRRVKKASPISLQGANIIIRLIRDHR